METNKEIAIEIGKYKAELSETKKELEKAKLQFINELNNGLGEELKTDFKNYNKPIKLKKPFKLKVREFIGKISKVLGF